MLKLIESILSQFRDCFSREKAFKWFVIAAVGFMLRSDHLGVTSLVRDLCLTDGSYETLLNFFHSSAYSLGSLRETWYGIIARVAPAETVYGRKLLVGDGVKQYKEGLRIPGVKKMHQESETCSKGEFIHGHLLGALGIIIGGVGKRFCLPLKINIQNGIRAVSEWPEAKGRFEASPDSHVEQMVSAGFEAARKIGSSFLLLDRYFLSKNSLKLWQKLNWEDGLAASLVELVTKAKANCSAFTKPPKREKGAKGRPPKRGIPVKLQDLFDTRKRQFRYAEVELYNENQTVAYYGLNLLWGQGLYQELRFVLVRCRKDGKELRSILVTTDTGLDPLTVIQLYSRRFGIEAMFREFKQQLGGFCYHFWTKSMPKLNHFAKTSDPDPLEGVKESRDRLKIIGTLRAIESFVMCASVAMGVLQMIALKSEFTHKIIKARYLRTRTSETPSEATVMYYLRKKISFILMRHGKSFVTKYIKKHQGEPEELEKAA